MEILSIYTALEADIAFLTQSIIASDSMEISNCSYQLIFNLSALECQKLLEEILAEEVIGTELSYIQHCIAKNTQQEPIGSCAGWIEQPPPASSNLQKALLLTYFLGTERWQQARTAIETVNELSIPRKIGAIQLESFYVRPDYRGIGVTQFLIDKMISYLLQKNTAHIPDTAQIQLFGNNLPALRAYQKAGFEIETQIECNNSLILNYFPYHQKILLSKHLS